MLILPNYQISTQIYESANSLIYRAVRVDDLQPVILKMLKEEYPTPDELARYRQEYKIINSLNFEGVIKTHQLEKFQNTLVIVLEDFGGESLKNLLNSNHQTEMSNQEVKNDTLEPNFRHPLFSNEQFAKMASFLSLAIQLADTLGEIHAQSVIHKDINPANIVWNQTTNQLKIIDFGIASRLPRENPVLKNPEQLEGTLAYISPEQTGRMNRDLDYRTDLYSLGVTFYELLTGKVPFESDSAMELVHCHIAKIPKPVAEINPKVPQIISDIVMKLMAKNVEDRYQSAFGVKADLDKIQENLTDAENLAGLDFELAQNDFSGKLQIPQKLYGREKEIETLLQAFERVSEGATEMMLVAGYSGVGKTALVHEVHKPMTEKRGYFAAGKFDQFQKNIPYSAIAQAFNQFCRYLLMENAETLGLWQKRILEAVGNNGQIIIDVILDLELVIGPQPAVVEVGSTEAQNRFQLFFLKFVKALCNKDHPFILFIDDLQWVDLASLNLLKSILLDHEIQHLFIIGAYRDNEVDSSHPFIMAVDELQTANAIVNTIGLANLQVNDINQLLIDSFSCESALTQPLTDLVYQKTQGNAFFTHQFLQILYQDALLRFDFEQRQWQWDVEKIAAQNITDNVVDLMANKIDKLPSDTSKALQLAACIGNQFDLSILAIIYEHEQPDTLDILHPALAEGLILPLDESYKHADLPHPLSKEGREGWLEKSQFKFLHDRVQQAAYALIEGEQKQSIHLQIGRLLLKNTPTDTLEDKVFDIVEQFNQSLELLNNQTEPLQVAKLNLMAGQKAKMASAYGAAINYFTNGRSCLSDLSWEHEYNLTVNLFTKAAEAAYLSGDFTQMEQLAQVVLQQAKTLSDEAEICEILIYAHVAQNQQQKAIQIALQFLKKLGISFPETLHQDHVELALQKIQNSLSGKPIQSLIDLPMMTDVNMVLAMRIMVTILPSTYHVSPQLMILLTVKQVELSLKYGNISSSAVSYIFYGLILCGIVKNIETGYQFGQLALHLLQLSDEKGFKTWVTFLFNCLVKHWKKPVRETLQPMLESYQISLETGNFEFAAYSIHNYSSYSYFVGKPLDVLEPELAQYCHATARIKQEVQLSWNYLYWQVILNLRGHSNNPCCLVGEVYDEKTQLPRHQQVNDRTAIHFLYLNKCILHYLFKEYTLSVENAEKAEQHLDGVTGLLSVVICYFYDSLARLALYSSLSLLEQETIFKKVVANQQKMQLWAKHAPMNFQHKYDLVEAEKARVLGKNWEAAELYEKAIAGAKENEYIHEEALAYELAAKFYLERGLEKFAQTYLKEAHYRYQQWGALAKVADLEERYPKWLKQEAIPVMPTTFTSTSNATILASTGTRTRTLQWLDLESVMKAAQTLSGEIVLSQLLSKMMRIVIENAGAEHGFLILPSDDKWVIEAEGAIDKEEVTVLHSLPVANHLPEVIVNYVARTHENVVLTNATQEGLYTENPYIKAHQTQSVLCFPIVYQQQLRAILYFENNLSIGAFTPQRLNVLQMLSSQIAISLENAQYANQLEEKVKQRTAQLALANEQITRLNELLTEENLRMSAELDIAKQLQQMVLPKPEELQQIEGLDIAGFMEPADEVGGDYYDVLQHDGRVKIGIGDVTGHGLESGVLMLMVQTAVRTLLDSGVNDAKQFLTSLNHTIYNNIQRMGTDKNLTLSLLDYQNRQWRITGQHEDILFVHQDGKIELIDTFELGFSVGLKNDIAKFVSQIEMVLQPGEGMVLYTDGITEAQNQLEEQYGIERLCQVISRHWHLSVQAIRVAAINEVRQFIGTQKVFDDITLLIIKQK